MQDHSRATRSSEALKVTVIGSLVNIALAAGKFTAGILGGSMAMVADAVHSLSDLATDLIVYVSVSIASQEADEDHPYGHGRAETIGAAATGAALILVSVFIIFEVIEKLMGARLTTPTWPALAGAVVSIVAKEVLYRYTADVGEKYDNKAIIANAWHHRTDALSSIGALLGIGGAMMGFTILDPIAAIFVVFMIAKVGGEILWSSLQDLMDVSLSSEDKEEITKIICNTSGVVSFHELKTRKLGGDKFVDVHIEVQPDISVSEAHNIAETVRFNLKGRGKAMDALVHIDAEEDIYYKVRKINRKEIEEHIAGHAAKIDKITGVSGVTIHYLGGKTLVEFDVGVDETVSIKQAREMASRLGDRLKQEKMIDNSLIRCRLTDDPYRDDLKQI
ncbi:MAG TPA: cation transporter [Nitrospirae bacterium]|nr:cation transporter [Nitrospirota bacterium]